MNKCNDHWCEHYGKGHSDCERCATKENESDKSYLRVMLQRRAVKQMELDKTSDRNQGQSR